MNITLRRGSTGAQVRMVQRLLNVAQDGIFGAITEEAVKNFQRNHGLTPDGIVGVKTWALLLGNVIRPSKRRITEIIVHCSATPAGADFTVADIRRWHKERGFSDIGYHYVIYRDGSVHEGRNVDMVGAHCLGHNANSIGICYIGGLATDGVTPKDTRTNQQTAALRTLLLKLRALYPQAKIYGHRDFANKACPCFDAKKEYADI